MQPSVQRSQTPATEQAAPSDLDAVIEATIKRLANVRSQGKIDLTPSGVEFGDFEGVQRYARMLVNSGCVPTLKDDDLDRMLARATMCILLGRRVGLSPEQAVSSIYVVNCRPTIFGSAPLAICRQHPAWVEAGFKEWFEVDGKPVKGDPDPKDFTKDTTAAVCQTMRRGASEPMTRRFSMAHAKQAGLVSRNALYGTYAQRMLLHRARGYCLSDNFGDALKGIGIKEIAKNDDQENPGADQEHSATPPTGRTSLKTNGHHTQAEPTPQPDQPAIVQAPELAEGELPPEKTPEQEAAELENEQRMVDWLNATTTRIEAAESHHALAVIGGEMTQALKTGTITRDVHHRALAAYQHRYREISGEGKKTSKKQQAEAAQP